MERPAEARPALAPRSAAGLDLILAGWKPTGWEVFVCMTLTVTWTCWRKVEGWVGLLFAWSGRPRHDPHVNEGADMIARQLSDKQPIGEARTRVA